MNLYPTEVTDEERNAGFELREVEHFETGSDTPSTITVVCVPIDESNRVVKIQDPNGITVYRHQRRAFWAFQTARDAPRWLPVFESHQDPHEAVRAANENRDRESDPKTVW